MKNTREVWDYKNSGKGRGKILISGLQESIRKINTKNITLIDSFALIYHLAVYKKFIKKVLIN